MRTVGNFLTQLSQIIWIGFNKFYRFTSISFLFYLNIYMRILMMVFSRSGIDGIDVRMFTSFRKLYNNTLFLDRLYYT
jgi:hypothetical protein